jgi:hypothetical protein
MLAAWHTNSLCHWHTRQVIKGPQGGFGNVAGGNDDLLEQYLRYGLPGTRSKRLGTTSPTRPVFVLVPEAVAVESTIGLRSG